MSKRSLPKYDKLKDWSVIDVMNWLSQNEFGDCKSCFVNNNIDGVKFAALTEMHLKGMPSIPEKTARKLLKLVREVEGSPHRKSSIWDSLSRGRNTQSQMGGSYVHKHDRDDENWEEEWSDSDDSEHEYIEPPDLPPSGMGRAQETNQANGVNRRPPPPPPGQTYNIDEDDQDEYIEPTGAPAPPQRPVRRCVPQPPIYDDPGQQQDQPRAPTMPLSSRNVPKVPEVKETPAPPPIPFGGFKSKPGINKPPPLPPAHPPSPEPEGYQEMNIPDETYEIPSDQRSGDSIGSNSSIQDRPLPAIPKNNKSPFPSKQPVPRVPEILASSLPNKSLPNIPGHTSSLNSTPLGKRANPETGPGQNIAGVKGLSIQERIKQLNSLSPDGKPPLPSNKPTPPNRPSPQPNPVVNRPAVDPPVNIPPKPVSMIGRQDDMYSFEWYHGKANRVACQEKLLRMKQDGCFLIRDSGAGGERKPYHAYTIQIYCGGRDYNVPIRQRDDNTYAMGKDVKKDQYHNDIDKCFKTLAEMVTYYKSHDINLKGVNTKLTRSAKR